MTIKDLIRDFALKRNMSLPELEATNDLLEGENRPVTGTDNVPDNNYIILSSNAKKLAPSQREQLLKMAELMFQKEFGD